jgi:hypothetical protein
LETRRFSPGETRSRPTSDISEIKLAGDDVETLISIEFKPVGADCGERSIQNRSSSG